MPNTLRVKRGLAATLPNGASGEPLFTTDTYELYIGKGDGTNQRYQKYIASGTTSQYIRGDGSLETHNLDSLTDVIVSSPSNGQFLKYNGSNWVNATGGFISGGATAAGQVGVWDSTTNIVGYTTFTYDTVTDKLSMTNGYVNNNLTVDGQLVIKSESGASAYTRGLKFPDNSYGGTGDVAGLRLHNAGGENIILELYAGNDSLDTINFAVAAGGSTYNDNVTINGNKIWNAGNLPSPLSSTGTINSGEIAIFSNGTTVYSDTALFWDNTLNRLGVGGASPNAQVGVSTSSGVNAFGYRTSGASYYELVLAYDNTTYGHTFQANRGSSTSARNITFLNGSNTVSIDESGNMGIGLVTPNPGTSGPGGLGLDIYGSTTAALAFHNGTSGTGISNGGRIYYNSTNMTIRNLETGNITITVDDGNFQVITLGAENIKVEGSTGKVGIGAPASIAEMLTVNGSIQQSGVTSSVLKANASGKIIAAVSNTDFQAPISLTTTGTSGAATFNGTTLNIPQYQGVLTNPVTGSGTNNEIAYFNTTGSTIASLSTATYPSLTELSYVKGVTSSIQTQLNGKQNTLTNPVTGTGTSGYHAKFTATGSTIGNSLIYDNGVRAISIGNSSTNSWASPFYVIEGGTYGQFIGFQTNNPAFKLGTNAYFNGTNYIYTNTGYGVGILDVGSDATNAYLDFYGAPTGTAGNAATISKKFSIDNTGNGYFVESLGIGFTTGTINGRIDFRNAGNAIIVGKNTTGGTSTYSSIRLTTANSGGVGDSIGEIRGLSTNSSNRDIALTFLTSEGSAGQTEKMRIDKSGNVGIGSSSPTYKLQVSAGASGNVASFSDGVAQTLTFSTDASTYYLNASNGGNIQFQQAGSNTMRITSGGNVGIGTTSPGLPLDVVINSATAYSSTSRANVIRAYNINTTSNTFAGIELAADGPSGAGIVGINGVVTGSGSGAMTFYTRDNSTFGERMRITSGGNVGIGTGSPDTYSYGGSRSFLTFRPSGTNQEPFLQLIADGAGNSLIDFGNATIRRATIIGEAGSNLVFLTNGSNSGTTTSERMRITSGGYLKASNDGTYYNSTAAYHELRNNTANGYTVYISNSSASPASTYIADFLFSGSTPDNNSARFLNCEDATATRCVIYSDGDLANHDGTYGQLASDIRLKENIINATSKLSDILKLNVVNYNFIGETHKQIGFIAQEFKEIFPSLVNISDTRKYDEEGNIISGYEDTLGLKVGMEFAIIVKAIQELSAQVEELKAKLN